MLVIEARLPTAKLPIKKIVAKLFQSYVYHHLDPKEHDGHRHPSGKLFKTTNFRIIYAQYTLRINFTAFDPQLEQKIALAILKEGLTLGEIKLVDTSVKLLNRHTEDAAISVKGFVSAAIKDGSASKKIYLEPKTTKFNEIITNHTLQKYETLYQTTYHDNLTIKLLHQEKEGRIFYYNKCTIKAWHAIYHITASSKMINLLLDTGIGANSMQGLGFVEVV